MGWIITICVLAVFLSICVGVIVVVKTDEKEEEFYKLELLEDFKKRLVGLSEEHREEILGIKKKYETDIEKQEKEIEELKIKIKAMQEDFETALYEGFEVSNIVLDGIVQYLTLNRYFVNEKFEIIKEPILVYRRYSPWPSDGYTIEKIVDRTEDESFKTKADAEEYVKTVARNLGVK